LVSQSIYGSVEMCSKIATRHVLMHLSLASLACGITRGQHDLLGPVLHHVLQLFTTNHINEESIGPVMVPQSSYDLRCLYVLGKHAILPNLPRPQVQLVHNHAYEYLKECVADLLGHGVPICDINGNQCGFNLSMEHIHQSTAALKIYEQASIFCCDVSNVLCLYVTEWSDGFDPTSGAKSNRGPCWIKTVTISPPPNSLDDLSHTYPIASGYDTDSHEAVEKLFASELKEFCNGKNITFYSGKQRCNMVVYLNIFATLQDQPERCKSNYLMLGGSQFHLQ